MAHHASKGKQVSFGPVSTSPFCLFPLPPHLCFKPSRLELPTHFGQGDPRLRLLVASSPWLPHDCFHKGSKTRWIPSQLEGALAHHLGTMASGLSIGLYSVQNLKQHPFFRAQSFRIDAALSQWMVCGGWNSEIWVTKGKGVWHALCGRAFSHRKIRFCVTGKQWGLTLESSRSGFSTNQPKQPKAQWFLIFSSVRLKGNSLLLAGLMLK